MKLVEQDEARQNRTASKRPAASRVAPLVGGVGRGGSSLPGWLESVLRQRGGVKENTTMQCLTKYEDMLRTEVGRGIIEDHGGWMALSPERRQELTAEIDAMAVRVVHVAGMFCPAMLSQTPPAIHIHSSNGTFVGWGCGREDHVYARCAKCRSESDSQWTHLTKDDLDGLLKGASGCAGQSVSCPCVCVCPPPPNRVPPPNSVSVCTPTQCMCCGYSVL